jgi:MFS family permease
MEESPLFSKLKAEGKISTNPLKESFTKKANLKMVLLALFGATMGQGVVWYTGQFYAQSFLENVCKIDFDQSRTMIIWAILFATPFFVVFGSWSDKVGRKWIMLTGMLLALFLYRPIYKQFVDLSDVESMEKTQKTLYFSKSEKRELIKDKPDSSVTTSIIKSLENGISYKQMQTDTLFASGTIGHSKTTYIERKLDKSTYWTFVWLVFIQIFLVTMVYGPIAAFLVEMFPTKIRYTSMSLPYHIGNGVFGGLTPFIATLLTTIYTGDKLVGLWYPLCIAALCLVIGALYVSNKIDPNVND